MICRWVYKITCEKKKNETNRPFTALLYLFRFAASRKGYEKPLAHTQKIKQSSGVVRSKYQRQDTIYNGR